MSKGTKRVGGTKAPVELAESVNPSPTAVAAEAQRTGVVPFSAAEGLDHVSRHDEERLIGEADPRTLAADAVGDQEPGGSMLNPELNSVDDIGRAVGVQEADSGALVTSSELLDARDRRRALAEGPEPDPED
jgi:hypothetical protein